MEWTQAHKNALEAMYNLHGSEDEAIMLFAELHEGIDYSEVAAQLSLLINGDPIDDVTLKYFNLVKKIPLKHRNMMTEFVIRLDAALRETYDFTIPKSYATPGMESLVVCLSDWHIGKHVKHPRNCYNAKVAELRVEEVTRNVIKLVKTKVSQHLKEIVIVVTGDMVDGHGIYPGQSYNQDLYGFYQHKRALRLLWTMFKTLAKTLSLPVRVFMVPGNHGGKDGPKDANLDLLLYCSIAAVCEEGRENNEKEGIDIKISYALSDELTANVNGKRVMLRHKMPPQIETPAASTKFLGLNEIDRYDIIVYGHLHHLGLGWIFDKPAVMNGCLCGPDDFSNQIVKFNYPKQFMFGIPADIDKPISFQYPIYIQEGVINAGEYYSQGNITEEAEGDSPDPGEE